MTKYENERIHKWLRALHGKADHCEMPGCLKRSPFYDWSLKKGFQYEEKRENFWQLCRSCHLYYDRPPATGQTVSYPNYIQVKDWRRRHPSYQREYMKQKRREWKEKYDSGEIDYQSVPVGYRCFKV